MAMIANQDPLQPTADNLIPDFTLQTADGQTISRSEFRGQHKNLVLIFCNGECGTMLREFADRYEQFQDANSEIVVVASNGAACGELPFRVAQDPDGQMSAEVVGQQGVTAIVLADEYAALRERWVGDLPSVDEVLSQMELFDTECPECGDGSNVPAAGWSNEGTRPVEAHGED